MLKKIPMMSSKNLLVSALLHVVVTNSKKLLQASGKQELVQKPANKKTTKLTGMM
jgi:hypothetical protein